jgi:hypothetical protein
MADRVSVAEIVFFGGNYEEHVNKICGKKEFFSVKHAHAL